MLRAGSGDSLNASPVACMPRPTHAHAPTPCRQSSQQTTTVGRLSQKPRCAGWWCLRRQQPLEVRSPRGEGCRRQAEKQLSCSCTADTAAAFEPTQTSAVSTSVTVRQATLEDYWAVAEVHCRSFYPRSGCITGPLLRLDRVKAIETGREKAEITDLGEYSCLVACEGPSAAADAGEGMLRAASLHRKLPAFFRGLVAKPLRAGFGRDPGDYGIVGTVIVDSMGEHVPLRKIGKKSERREGMAYVSNLAVEPAHRRKGIALLLLQRAAKLALEWGCHAIVLQIDRNNAGARELYLRAGYRRVAEEPAFLPWLEMRPQSRLELMVKVLGKHP